MEGKDDGRKENLTGGRGKMKEEEDRRRDGRKKRKGERRQTKR